MIAQLVRMVILVIYPIIYTKYWKYSISLYIFLIILHLIGIHIYFGNIHDKIDETWNKDEM